MIDDNGGSKQALSVPVFGLEIDLNGHLVPGEQDFFFFYCTSSNGITLEAEGINYS